MSRPWLRWTTYEEVPGVDLKQLRALVTVVDTGSVTRAAHLLNIVQPAVTRQIKALEHELGVQLFERTPAGMSPTPQGDALAERARRALGELERARLEVRPEPHTVRGIVTVGLLESMTHLVAEDLVTEVARRHPDIRLRLLTAYSGHLQSWLDNGDVDLTLLYNIKSSHTLNVVPVAREQLWAAAPTRAGLSAGSPVQLNTLSAHPIVAPSPGHGLRILMDEALARAGVTPTVVAETNSMDVQKRLVQAGHGWTVLPGIGVAEDVAAGRLSASPLDDPSATRQVVLARALGVRVRPAIEVVSRILMTQLRKAISTGRWPSAVS